MKFKDRDIQLFWEGVALPRRVPPDCRKTLFRKLQMLDAARDVADLRIPPNNRLEKLSGSRAGQYSIRVNRQWRLCFVWSGREAREVEFCDYH
ncbi:type II toxin-antitoxin system RelE/ParE family toxin [Adlercreutzia sp. ZJ138]|uniref:type II toxin-antitoxin system RelE/ParE family toxin n=1 Tax=Adlercreutzia sp. ZJ138 TaxID=2709405 RepID=UPI0013EB7C8E|nr:type II toxin-antitoxin system RelE/ParE family toxin [Adlercreutzia sp. ZJ138]